MTHRCCAAAEDGWRVAVGGGQIAVGLCRRVERQAVIRDAVLSCVVLCGKRGELGGDAVLRGMRELRGVSLGHRVRRIAGLLITLQMKAYIKPLRPSHMGWIATDYMSSGDFNQITKMMYL